MARIDDPTIRNPFGWRLADAADPSCSDARRRRLRAELLVLEAEELAHGCRHLTVVHGDPPDLAASRYLSAFYDTLSELAAECEWVRVRGDGAFVTVTVRGAHAEVQLARFTAAALGADPGDWTVVASAVPPRIT
ncbi:MAG: hypothetical protein AB7R77_16280 [Ilumatobacteraceae bacterium]